MIKSLRLSNRSEAPENVMAMTRANKPKIAAMNVSLALILLALYFALALRPTRQPISTINTMPSNRAIATI